jgi:hypothetical protein
METKSGHVVEYDDTPGGERILIKHKSGSGVELRADGSYVCKTERNSVTVVGGSSQLIVDGEANMKFNGNLNLSVAGDLNLDVGGNINTTVGGDKKEIVNGSARETIYGSAGSTVKGNRSNTTVGVNSEINLGGFNEIVKGNKQSAVQGNLFTSVSGTFKQTSEGEMILSSDDMNIAASNMSVFGASGTIGGSGMVMYATTFHGSLKGVAEQAITADITNSQNYLSTSTGSVSGYTITNETSASADATLMDAYLNNSVNGIVKVNIDEGDYLKNSIDKSKSNQGISDRDMSTSEIRSALREPSNMANNNFLGQSVSEGKISSTYSAVIPSGANRIASKTGNVRVPSAPLIKAAAIERYRPFKNTDVSRFTPNPAYIPSGTPTSSTEIGNNIRLSRFLGAEGDKVTLNHIATSEEKLNITRQFMLHASALESVSYSNHSIVVVEGLYKKGPSETLTSGTTNDLATKGRVAVYEVRSGGKIDFDKTFELATWWKDTINFDKLSLSYDTFNPDGSLTAQIILEMPEINSDFELVSGRYQNKIETLYNNAVQGQDLIEVVES